MKIKTSELTGPALDWAVAKCIWPDDIGNTVPFHHDGSDYAPARKWAHGGPIVEKWVSDLCQRGEWYAQIQLNDVPEYAEASGPTPLVAAMRCFVASKLGDEVEVPEAL